MSERWAPLNRQNWPQMVNRVPRAGGMWMPPIDPHNAARDRQECFTLSGTFNIPAGFAAGLTMPLYLATDQDGDFWCDQIYLIAWVVGASKPDRTPPATLSIADARTGRSLTWPASVNTNFLTTQTLLANDPGFNYAGNSNPFPDGFRSTSTLAQPYCFTRAGGISLVLTMLGADNAPPNAVTVDVSFSGWKEYAYASP